MSSSSPFPSCFRPSPTSPPPHSRISNNTVYHTDRGPVSLTWSRSMVGRSLHIQLHQNQNPLDSPPYPSTLSFHIQIRPFLFWKKHGSKKLAPNTLLFWNFSNAKFGASPEPLSAFYVALVVHNHMTLLLGDSPKEAYSRSKARHPNTPQLLLLRKEHVFADRLYTTRATFAGKSRQIQIDCGYQDHSSLCFSVDGQMVLQIKRLKWKFRGNERVLVHGVHVQISWDLYNWLFDKNNLNSDSHAIFMFKFEDDDIDLDVDVGDRNNLLALSNLGLSESSSSSLSSSAASFAGNSSVLEWSSVEENDLVVPLGFSLLVYAWKR